MEVQVNMNTKIRGFLDKHPQIDYFQKMLRYANNSEFRKSVLKLYNSPDFLELSSYGEENKGKIIYAIEYDNPKSGFYAVYKNILEYLFFCDYHGLVPVIKYPSHWLDSDMENPFETYFEQPSGIQWGVFQSRSVVHAKYYHRYLIHQILGTGTYYNDTEREIKEFGRLKSKYLRYLPSIQARLDKEVSELFKQKKVLGVHIRGTDYKREFNGHPIYVGIQDYLMKIDKVLGEHYDAIFLATDDQNAVNVVREKFKRVELLSFDSFRSDGNVSVAMLKSNRENHKELLGYEVIRDAVALSLCDGFIGNLSMVSLAAQIEAEARDHKFIDKIILTNGINNNSRKLSDFERKL